MSNLNQRIAQLESKVRHTVMNMDVVYTKEAAEQAYSRMVSNCCDV